jgi:hypothetical protein
MMTAQTLKNAMEPIVRPPNPRAPTYPTVIDEKKNAMINPTVDNDTKKLAKAAFTDDEMNRSANATTPISAAKPAMLTCTQKPHLKIIPTHYTSNILLVQG